MTIVLHHYPESLFSEKVRLLLGYHDCSWQSVIIPNIMPRPLLMPLSGGYRRTPVLQMDANVYCDSRIIAWGLARASADWSLYEPGFPALRLADWADSELFQITVAMNFRPDAIAAMMGRFSATDAAAFQADRAKLAEGGNIVSMSPLAAEAKLLELLADLDRQLERQDYLFGTRPSIADFSVYHCLWFLNNNPVNAELLVPHQSVQTWMQRMAAIGHGTVEDSDAAGALALGRDSEPVAPEIEDPQSIPGISPGDEVAVTPADYGRIPVTGRLVAASRGEVVILREDPEAGRIMNHFPRWGFEVTPAGN